ncbi:MAG: hypothetical protein K5629_00610 [Eubacteriales bacterium]|nr:hypothetical protein [Eubacteriales bacterium]
MAKKKNGFGFGLMIGIAAGAAAKYLLDNKEEIKTMAAETAQGTKEGFEEAVNFATDKFTAAAGDLVDRVKEYVEYAKQQFNDIKETLVCSECECDGDCDCDCCEGECQCEDKDEDCCKDGVCEYDAETEVKAE